VHTTVTQEYTPTPYFSTTASATSEPSIAPSGVSGEFIASAVLGGVLGFVLLLGLAVLIHRKIHGQHLHDPESFFTPFDASARSANNSVGIRTSEMISSPSSTTPSRFHKFRPTMRVASPMHSEPPPGYHSPQPQ
jgi:hypothetical protein